MIAPKHRKTRTELALRYGHVINEKDGWIWCDGFRGAPNQPFDVRGWHGGLISDVENLISVEPNGEPAARIIGGTKESFDLKPPPDGNARAGYVPPSYRH